MTITAGSNAGAGHRGRFWLQGEDQDKAIPGRLFLQAGAHPMLELDGALAPQEREVSRRKLPDGIEVRTFVPVLPNDPSHQSLVVHGVLDETGEPVTLPSVFAVGGTFPVLGTGPRGQRVQAFYALVGAHVDGADAQFTRIRVRPRHLDAWAALPDFTLTPDLSARQFTLTFRQPEAPSAALGSGARITLEQVAGWNGPTVCGGLLERHLWVDVLDMPPAAYLDLERRIVKPLMNLLTLAVSTECPLVAVMVSTGPDHPWLTVHSAAMTTPAEEILPLPRILLPLAETGMTGVATWLDSTSHLGPLPSVVARVASSQDDTVEAQLLELTTVAEGLHRLLLPEGKRMTKQQASEARGKALEAVKDLDNDVRDAVQAALNHLTDQSYPRRLLDLAGHVEPAVPGVTGNTTEWKKRVTSARNDFAHKFEHGFLDEATAEESVAILLSLQWVLTGMLLLQTGISSATLGSRLANHEPYQLFLAQARTWLPAVYNSSESSAK
jgi:ApeA N-terminal domain 1